ncbi:MAG: tetratricopeptide repeat protein [Chitinophagales bacterium]
MKSSVMIMLGLASSLGSFAQSTEDGIKSIDYENFATAKRIFNQLIRQNPVDGRNYYYLGEAHNSLAQLDSARIAYSAGITADPKSIYNYIGLGRTFLDQNNLQKAKENFDKAQEFTSPKDILQYVLLADAYASGLHPNYQEAVNQLNKAITYNNKSADVYWQLGLAYEGQRKGGEAVSAYERAAELNPSFAKALTHTGVIWRLARNYNQSLASFQKALQADQNFPPAYREMAELYFYTGQFDKAKEAYQKYLDLADKDDYTQFRYAQYLFLTKDYQGSLSILDALRAKIDIPVMYRLSAYSNYESGNYETGLEQINTYFKKVDSARILPSDYEYYAKLLSKSGQDSLAILNYQEAIELDSTNFPFYNDIGAIYFQEKKYHEASEAYQKKVDASKKDATLQDYFNVGKSAYFAKDFMEADTAFASMSEMNKQWPISYFWRARVMTNLDNPDSVKGLAAPYYQQVIEKALVDTVKYKKELIESYKYLGDINALNENYGASLYYYNKHMTLDSANLEVPKTMESVKALYKNTSSSVTPLQKDDHGLYLIPATVNNNPINFIFDPSVSGMVVTEQTAGQFFGSANGKNVFIPDNVKIAGRTVKNPQIIIDANLIATAVIGPDALNQFNIIFDYGSGSLLLR